MRPVSGPWAYDSAEGFHACVMTDSVSPWFARAFLIAGGWFRLRLPIRSMTCRDAIARVSRPIQLAGVGLECLTALAEWARAHREVVSCGTALTRLRFPWLFAAWRESWIALDLSRHPIRSSGESAGECSSSGLRRTGTSADQIPWRRRSRMRTSRIVYRRSPSRISGECGEIGCMPRERPN